MSQLFLKENPHLEDFQKYVALAVQERGFDKESISEIFMLFLEECGDLVEVDADNGVVRILEKN